MQGVAHDFVARSRSATLEKTLGKAPTTLPIARRRGLTITSLDPYVLDGSPGEKPGVGPGSGASRPGVVHAVEAVSVTLHGVERAACVQHRGPGSMPTPTSPRYLLVLRRPVMTDAQRESARLTLISLLGGACDGLLEQGGTLRDFIDIADAALEEFRVELRQEGAH